MCCPASAESSHLRATSPTSNPPLRSICPSCDLPLSKRLTRGISRALSRSGARRLHSFVSRASASCSPALQRCGALPRWQAKQQSLDRNILVEVWPVNPDAWTNQLPTSSLAWSPFSQAGVPVDWDRHAPTIAQLDDECVLGDLNVLGRRGFRWQTCGSHVMTSAPLVCL